MRAGHDMNPRLYRLEADLQRAWMMQSKYPTPEMDGKLQAQSRGQREFFIANKAIQQKGNCQSDIGDVGNSVANHS